MNGTYPAQIRRAPLASAQVNHGQRSVTWSNGPPHACRGPCCVATHASEGFPDTAALIAQLFAGAHIALAALKAHGK
jgi:hypothetical protein